MRKKKPDSLLLLAVLVVSGVIISNFVVFKDSTKMTDLSLLNNHYSSSEKDNRVDSQFNTRNVVHIDSSKQQIR